MSITEMLEGLVEQRVSVSVHARWDYEGGVPRMVAWDCVVKGPVGIDQDHDEPQDRLTTDDSHFIEVSIMDSDLEAAVERAADSWRAAYAASVMAREVG